MLFCYSRSLGMKCGNRSSGMKIWFGLVFLKRTHRILLINWYCKMFFVKLPSKKQTFKTILCGWKVGAALTPVQYRFPSKVKYSCWYPHRSANSILLRLTAHPVPFDQVMPLNVLNAAKVKFCYPKGVQNPRRSPSYCWPISSSLGRVEMTYSLHCVSCWKPELAEIAVLLPDGEEQCQFPTDTLSRETGTALWVNLAMYNADYGERVKLMYRYVFEWRKRCRESFFFWDTSDFYKVI